LEKVRCVPDPIVTDNGTEFTTRAMDRGVQHKVKLRLITPGKPMENGCDESFHGKFRENAWTGTGS
jgi:putative transposase